METLEKETEFPPITELDQMITRDDALKAYSWLTAHKLSKWANDGVIRSYSGKDRMPVFVKADIIAQVNKELNSCQRSYGNTKDIGLAKKTTDPDGIKTGTMQNVAKLEEESSRRKILKMPKTN